MRLIFLPYPKIYHFTGALSDAYYTGRVLAKIKDPQVLQMISFDGFIVPHNKKEEVHIVFDDYAKYISRDFADKQELLADKEVSSTKCYLCHRNLKRRSGGSHQTESIITVYPIVKNMVL